MTVEAFPLQWPTGRVRTSPQRRRRARFDVPLGSAIMDVRDQVRLMGGRGLVISSNLPLRRDGFPLANPRGVSDPGAAAYFTTRDGLHVAFACDRWDAAADNIRAIGKTIGALRGIERWGTGDMVRAAFTGFKALPAAAGGGSPWWVTLGVAPDATLREAETAYRAAAKVAHPDTGAPREAWDRLQDAWRQARAATAPAAGEGEVRG